VDALGGAGVLTGIATGLAGVADAVGVDVVAGALGGSLKEVNFVLSKDLALKAGLVAESNFF
jgi:hypothetical protein